MHKTWLEKLSWYKISNVDDTHTPPPPAAAVPSDFHKLNEWINESLWKLDERLEVDLNLKAEGDTTSLGELLKRFLQCCSWLNSKLFWRFCQKRKNETWNEKLFWIFHFLRLIINLVIYNFLITYNKFLFRKIIIFDIFCQGVKYEHS